MQYYVYSFCKKRKKEKYHNVETILKSNRNIIETVANSIPLTHKIWPLPLTHKIWPLTFVAWYRYFNKNNGGVL
jgi:hypothetical protein